MSSKLLVKLLSVFQMVEDNISHRPSHQRGNRGQLGHRPAFKPLDHRPAFKKPLDHRPAFEPLDHRPAFEPLDHRPAFQPLDHRPAHLTQLEQLDTLETQVEEEVEKMTTFEKFNSELNSTK